MGSSPFDNPALANPLLYRKVKDEIQDARKIYSEFIKNGTVSYDSFKAVLLMAQLDMIHRAGIVAEDLGNVDDGDIQDLRNLMSIVKPEQFKANKVCVLNPIVGGELPLPSADCDLIIDETLIDIKTTKKLELTQDFFNQIMGYYILYKIGGIKGMSTEHKITKLGIYFSRHAYLFTFNVRDVCKKNTFPRFAKWYTKRWKQELDLWFEKKFQEIDDKAFEKEIEDLHLTDKEKSVLKEDFRAIDERYKKDA